MGRIMKLLVLAILLGTAILSPLLNGCSSDKASAGGATEGYKVGDTAPGFGLHTTTGQAISLGDYRGRPVLLNFWATWCPPCRAEMPLLQEVSQDKELAARGLAVLGVDLGEKAEVVDSFMKGNGYTFPVVLDSSQIVSDTYNVRSIPTTFFIDKDGIIREVRIGAFASKAQILIALRKIMP